MRPKNHFRRQFILHTITNIFTLLDSANDSKMYVKLHLDVHFWPQNNFLSLWSSQEADIWAVRFVWESSTEMNLLSDVLLLRFVFQNVANATCVRRLQSQMSVKIWKFSHTVSFSTSQNFSSLLRHHVLNYVQLHHSFSDFKSSFFRLERCITLTYH